MGRYEDFRIFWEAWKQNTKRPLSETEAANWDAAAAIFMAIAAGSSDAGTREALAFVRNSLPGWHARLKRTPNGIREHIDCVCTVDFGTSLLLRPALLGKRRLRRTVLYP